jgi:tRNA pseudouridine55 synthase/H/ACA ribonucleoprotein complex subunit 4
MNADIERTDKTPIWDHPGILVIDKPRGPSSHQVAAWVGRMLGCQVGHAGTLDPQVSGVLLVMLGNAVRLAPLLLQHDKEYICLMRLQGDADKTSIEQIAAEFTGRLYQRPPRKSAVKRILRIRTIHKMEILHIEGRLVLFRVECDAGTYIRSLCHHMGLALGTGAHMVELRRIRSGPFREQEMHTLFDIQDACSAVKEGDSTILTSMVLSVDAAVPDLPTIIIRNAAIDAICHGAVLAGVGVISFDDFKRDQTVAVLSQKKEFICLGRALVHSSSFKAGETGLVVAPIAVFLRPGTYPNGWATSSKEKRKERENAPVQKKNVHKKEIALKKFPANR